MASDGTWSYTWEHGRQLKTMSKSGTTWTYTYDANGMRTKRTTGSTTYQYFYTGSQLKKMTVGSNTLLFQYGTTGMPVSLTYNNTRYYYVTNLQGDVIAILNGSGTAVVTYTYDAWGNILTTGGSMASTLGTYNPLRYRGYVYDQETGLYYLQSRYYNPAMGRFINADGLVSTGQGTLGYNMFAYCLNNPVNLIDPDGNIPFADDPYAETYQQIGNMIYNWLKSWYDNDREKAETLSYQKATDGAKIVDSYKITNPIVMYEFVNANRGDEVDGTTTGVVVEWIIHDAAYAVGDIALHLGFTDLGTDFKKRGGDVDIGRTIYDDNHGAMSYLMWTAYKVVSPITAAYDLWVKITG